MIGQNNLMNIYYQSEILSSPHRITAYESAQPIQTFMLQTTRALAMFADVGIEDLEAILENKDSKNTKSSIKKSANICLVQVTICCYCVVSFSATCHICVSDS